MCLVYQTCILATKPKFAKKVKCFGNKKRYSKSEQIKKNEIYMKRMFLVQHKTAESNFLQNLKYGN